MSIQFINILHAVYVSNFMLLSCVNSKINDDDDDDDDDVQRCAFFGRNAKNCTGLETGGSSIDSCHSCRTWNQLFVT